MMEIEMNQFREEEIKELVPLDNNIISADNIQDNDSSTYEWCELTEDDNAFEAEFKFNFDTSPQQILMMSIDNDNSNNEMIMSSRRLFAMVFWSLSLRRPISTLDEN